MNDEAEEQPPESNTLTRYFIVGGLIGIIVVFGVIFSLRQGPPEAPVVDYNYFSFKEVEGFWETDIQIDNQPFVATFRYNPLQVEDVYISGNFSGFTETPIYITFDPESESEQFKYLALAASELSLHLIRGLNFTVEAACTKNMTDACINRSVVNCGDENTSVILIKSEPPTQINLDNHCISLSGHEFDLLKSVDRLLFQWYKIMTYNSSKESS